MRLLSVPKEVAIKVRYTIELEKQFTYPTWDYETDNDVKDRIELDIEHDKDEFIEAKSATYIVLRCLPNLGSSSYLGCNSIKLYSLTGIMCCKYL